jgi:hypothetical protein
MRNSGKALCCFQCHRLIRLSNYTALRSKWTEWGPEGCALNETFNWPKAQTSGLWFPKGVTQPGLRFTRVLPILTNPILSISYPPHPLPAGSQFTRGKTQMWPNGCYTGTVRPIVVTTILGNSSGRGARIKNQPRRFELDPRGILYMFL